MEQLPSSIPENTADYYDEDGLLYCGRCHTPKEAFFAKGVALMGKNKHPIECSCQRIERAKQEALISQQKHSDLVRRPKAEGFSDPAMLDWKFENDNGRSPQMCHAHRYVEQWQTMRAENLGLFLWGGVGTGKSFLAGCIANALMEQEVSMHMTNFAEVHRLLGTAFQYAVEWGILVKSPVPVDSPKKSTQERIIWTVEEMRAALDSMEDLILHLAVHLTLVGALREGEIVGLTPEDLDFDAADGIGTFRCHLSQLMISGGDIKAVQGTTGHASADMLVNTYAHIQQSSRVELGKKFESGFYAKPDTPSPQAVPAAGEPTISMTALLELLKNADPEVKAQLRLALLT